MDFWGCASASLLGPAFFVVCLLLFVVLPDYYPNLSLICKLLYSNSIKIWVINHDSQILIRFSSDFHQIFVRFSSEFHQILVRFLSDSHTMVFFKAIVTQINSLQPRRLKAFSVLLCITIIKCNYIVSISKTAKHFELTACLKLIPIQSVILKMSFNDV